MLIRVSSPDKHLSTTEVSRIEKDLEKIDRRLHDYRNVTAEVRVSGKDSAPERSVTIELHYGRRHLIAKSRATDVGIAVRDARKDLLRQINSHSRGGHSSFIKGR